MHQASTGLLLCAGCVLGSRIQAYTMPSGPCSQAESILVVGRQATPNKKIEKYQIVMELSTESKARGWDSGVGGHGKPH